MFWDSCFTYCYYVKNFFQNYSAAQEMLKVIKILLRENAFIWNRDSDLSLWGTSVLCISSMLPQCHNIQMKKFFQGHYWVILCQLNNRSQQKDPRWTSQILLKLCTSVPINEIRKLWKFQLENLSSSRNIGIQS